MEYLAHRNEHGEKQALKEYPENKAALCVGFVKKLGVYDWEYCCDFLNNIGKYSEKFQERILISDTEYFKKYYRWMRSRNQRSGY